MSELRRYVSVGSYGTSDTPLMGTFENDGKGVGTAKDYLQVSLKYAYGEKYGR